MKVKKWIEYSEEVDVEITAEDLSFLYLEDEAGTRSQVTRLVSRAYEVLNEISPEMLTDEQREIIADALARQAYRFDPRSEDFDPIEHAQEIARVINRKNWRHGADPKIVHGEDES